MSTNTISPANEGTAFYSTTQFENQVKMNNISWEEDEVVPKTATNVLYEINNIANGSNNPLDLKMFKGCKYNDDGKNLCMLEQPEPVEYKFSNPHTWSNAYQDKVIISGYEGPNNTLTNRSANLSKRGLSYLKQTNDELLVKPLCDVYDCANKSKDDPNCRRLNCMVCAKK